MAAGAALPADRRLRIVHCFRNPVGGLFRHVRDLAREQAAAGHEVGIICDSTTGGAFEERLFVDIEPYLALGLRRIPMRRQIAFSDLSAARRVAAVAKQLSPDVLHGHGAKGGAYARFGGTILRASGVRVARIYTPHGGSMHYDPRRLRYRFYFRAERMLERMTDAFIFVSRYESDAYRQKVGAPRPLNRIVPNGVRPEEFEPVHPDPDAADFLYVGMLRDLKGPDVFIDALALLRDRRGHAPTAHIVGAGDDAPRYRSMVQRLGLPVTFHDPMPARTAFALGRTLVIPSRAESMPYIVLEAAAAAIPMIATRVGGIPEVFDQHSEWLVRPGDPVALADAMGGYLDAPTEALSRAATLRARVAEINTVAVMAASIEGVYREALR